MAEDRNSYTVEEFCEAERMSRSMVYKLWKEGKGPKFYWVGTVRRISHEARIEWQRQMEAEAGGNGHARPHRSPSGCPTADLTPSAKEPPAVRTPAAQ